MNKNALKILSHDENFRNYITCIIAIICFTLFVLFLSRDGLKPYQKKEVTKIYTTEEIDEYKDQTIYRTTYEFKGNGETYFDNMCIIESNKPNKTDIKYIYVDKTRRPSCYTKKPINVNLIITLSMSFGIPFIVVSLICIPMIIKRLIRIKKMMKKENKKNER